MWPGAAFGALQATVAVACLLALPPAAQAQELDNGHGAYALASPSDPTDDLQPAKPLTADESALLGHALLFDPANIAGGEPARALKLPSLSKPRDLSVNGNENPDGTRKVTVKQPLAAAEWEANVGADLNPAPAPPTSFEPGKPFPATVDNAGSGAAWASVGIPDIAAVDARVNPANDQGQVGAALKLPLGEKLSVTVQDRYSVTEIYNAPAAAPAPPSNLPPAAAPTPSEPVVMGPAQVIGNDRSVKLNIQPTGTTLGAGFTSASNDPVTHNTLSAEQKIYGPLHVTTAVTDLGQTTSSKSISAGFKVNW
jgi:hypothetical protein